MPKAGAISDLPRQPAWGRSSSPYHDGEQALQERAGARSFAERMGRQVIRDFMTDQHRAFFAELPFVVVGSVDIDDKRPWASVLVGYPGFMNSSDRWHLTLDAHPIFGDPLGKNLAVGAPMAFVGAQLETRRRNRMSGRIVSATDGAFTVKVDQSFGNCPQYIQARTPGFVGDPAGVGAPRPFDVETAVLSDQAIALIRRSDTFFIASASPGAGGDDPVEGVDVNHRGGKPGFVQVTKEDDRTILLSPDFVGNFAFSTFGNILRNPRAGLLFIDFATGDVLSVTGDAEVIWDMPEEVRLPGAERLLRFCVSAGVFIKAGIPLRWSDPVAAPQIAATGTWTDPRRTATQPRQRLRAFTPTQEKPMKIALIGATGYTGAPILTEALDRGHEVTAIVRDTDKLPAHSKLTAKKVDASDKASLAAAIVGHDVVISAFNPGKDENNDGTRSILAAVKEAGTKRFLVVGGAGSLEIAPGKRLIDQPDFPAEWKDGATKTAAFLDVLRAEPELNWTFVCPAAMLAPGERTGKYRVGGDQLLVDEKGESRISTSDYAVAMIDEVEKQKHGRTRFTVAY